jgi:hypothetical protein
MHAADDCTVTVLTLADTKVVQVSVCRVLGTYSDSSNWLSPVFSTGYGPRTLHCSAGSVVVAILASQQCRSLRVHPDSALVASRRRV